MANIGGPQFRERFLEANSSNGVPKADDTALSSGGPEFRKRFLDMNNTGGTSEISDTVLATGAALSGEVFHTIDMMPKIEGLPKEAFDELIVCVKHQIARDSAWEKVRIVRLEGKAPSPADTVLPNARKISELYKNIIDSQIIPAKHYMGGNSFYVLPASVEVREGTVVGQILVS